jgi:hypothetical protein
MMNKPTGILETSLGNIGFTMTEAAHVYLHTEARLDEAITIRGIRYHVSCHLHLVDGLWKTNSFHELYLSRKDHALKNVSRPALKSAEAALTGAWTKYIGDHPELSQIAETASVCDMIERLTIERDDYQSKLNPVEAELTAHRERLQTLNLRVK